MLAFILRTYKNAVSTPHFPLTNEATLQRDIFKSLFNLMNSYNLLQYDLQGPEGNKIMYALL